VIIVAAFAAARQGIPPYSLVLAAGLGSFASLYLLYLSAAGPFRRAAARFIRSLSARTDDLVRGFYDRWGYGVILVSRFLPAVRGPLTFLGGVYGLKPLPVALLLLPACLIWNALVVLLGYRAGERWDGSLRGLTLAGISLAASLAGLWILGLLLRYLMERLSKNKTRSRSKGLTS
jgi:membrane protein DedA with SNARE-associated domain